VHSLCPDRSLRLDLDRGDHQRGQGAVEHHMGGETEGDQIPTSASKAGGNTTTPDGQIVLWITARLRQKLSWR
jgi:hypothetical protein